MTRHIAPRHKSTPLEDIAPFAFPAGREAAKRALELAGVKCNHHLLLDRHRAACRQKRRDWPHRMLTGDRWHGLEEYRQALIDAPRVSGETRNRRWGLGETRILLGHLVAAGLVDHDADNHRWRERLPPRGTLLDATPRHRHNARNRARYQEKTEAERAHRESLEWEYGPICEETRFVSDLENPSESHYNAPQSNSPAVYNTAARSNHSAERIFEPSQPSASDADLELPDRIERPAANRGVASSPTPAPRPIAELRAALLAQYQSCGDRLSRFDAEDAAWVAQWMDRHEGMSDVPGAMARRHKHWRASGGAQARVPSVSKTAFSAHISPVGLTKPAFPTTLPPHSSPHTPPPLPAFVAHISQAMSHKSAAKLPVIAQPKAQLASLRAEVLALCQALPQGQAPTRRLNDLDELLAALSAPRATLAQVRQLCANHPWASTLAPDSAVAVGASIDLWHYIARRIETKAEPATVSNAPGLLLWRVRQWQRAQVTDKGLRCA